MSVTFFLTDEDAGLSGYLRAILGSRSTSPSLVRAITSTEAGPSSGIQVTRSAGGTALAWITDPLDGVDLTAAAWVFHVWASESAAAANAALRFQVLPFTTAEQTAALDDNNGTELTTTMADYARTSGNATATALAAGDRLVFKILIDDAASSMAASQTVTVAYNGLYAGAEGDSYLTCPDNLKLLARTPGTTRDRVRALLRDVDVAVQSLPDGDLDDALADAVIRYSQDRPLEVRDTFSGDGTTYEFRLPRRWVRGFSRILEIEHPTGEQVRSTVDPEDYEVYGSSLGLQPTWLLRFPSAPPESGTDNVAVRYTTLHSHTDQTDTVPSGHWGALCYLAASCAAVTMAAKMANSSDSTIAADAVNHRDGEQRWRSVARAMEQKYRELIGVATAGPAGVTVDWDTNLGQGLGDRLWHTRRRR